MKRKKKSINLSRAAIRNRLIWLILLFVVAGSVAYPNPTNWLIEKTSSIVGFNIPKIERPFVLGLDLQGGTHLEYEADVSKVAVADREDALTGVRDVIERRVNSLGVSEPLVQTTQAGDSWRVTVELAGIRDVNQAVKLIGETPILEFKEQNPTQSRNLTPEEQTQKVKKNAEEQTKAEDLLKQAQADGADSAALAKANTDNAALKDASGDTGFIKGDVQYKNLLDTLRTVPAGTVFDQVIEEPSYYTVAKVEEVTDVGEQVHAQHLLVSYQGASQSTSSRTKDEAKALIEDYKKQVTPKNFDQFVRDHSDEPGAKTSGGDLGFFSKGDMVQAFEDIVFSQETGTISDIVETPFGYHLIYKINMRPDKDLRLRLIQVKKTVDADIVPPQDPWKLTDLTGKQLSSARVEFDQNTGATQVSLQFDKEGSDLFAELTKKNLNKPIAIFLDGQIISQPVVQAEILGGRAVISGNFSIDEAKTLARRLQAGALPIPINLIAQQTVGPTLGADSLHRSLVAGLIGFILVAIYMLILYRLPGLAAILALWLYAALSAAFFKLIPVTLTLSGVAGFILSIGIAVDANVLVFERLKEELREGKILTNGLEDAFRRAWPSIRDGHATILISSAVLFWFSSSLIKGFALTLGLGTILSLFTAIISTRSLLRWFVRTRSTKIGWLYLKSESSKTE